jgi:hypothetical protein
LFSSSPELITRRTEPTGRSVFTELQTCFRRKTPDLAADIFRDQTSPVSAEFALIHVPILLRGNRTPNLNVKKGAGQLFKSTKSNLYLVYGGFIEGDVISSPIDGYLLVSTSGFAQVGYMKSFNVNSDIYPNIDPETLCGFMVMTSPVRPLFGIDSSKDNVNSPAKRGQPIFEMLASIGGQTFSPQIKIVGQYSALTDVTLNLATSSGGKAILLK